MQEVYNKVPYNQLVKLHKSIKSTTDHKDWLCKTDIQSNKVLQKNNLRSDIGFSIYLQSLGYSSPSTDTTSNNAGQPSMTILELELININVHFIRMYFPRHFFIIYHNWGVEI